MDFADLVLLKGLVCFKQFWCLNFMSLRCSDRTCTGLLGSLGHLLLGQFRTRVLKQHCSTKAVDTLCACWAGISLEETQLGLWGKAKIFSFQSFNKVKVFKEKSGNMEWTPNEPKRSKYLPDTVDVCWSDVLQKNLQQQVGFLRRPVPSSAYLSFRGDQHWASKSCFHFL